MDVIHFSMDDIHFSMDAIHFPRDDIHFPRNDIHFPADFIPHPPSGSGIFHDIEYSRGSREKLVLGDQSVPHQTLQLE